MISRTILALTLGVALAAGGAALAETANGTAPQSPAATHAAPAKSDAMKTTTGTLGSKSTTKTVSHGMRTTKKVSVVRTAPGKGSKSVMRVSRSHHARVGFGATARLRFAGHIAPMSHVAKRPLAKRV